MLRPRDAGDLLRFAREQPVRTSDDHVLTPYSWAAEHAHLTEVGHVVGTPGYLAPETISVGVLSGTRMVDDLQARSLSAIGMSRPSG